MKGRMDIKIVQQEVIDAIDAAFIESGADKTARSIFANGFYNGSKWAFAIRQKTVELNATERGESVPKGTSDIPTATHENACQDVDRGDAANIQQSQSKICPSCNGEGGVFLGNSLIAKKCGVCNGSGKL